MLLPDGHVLVLGGTSSPRFNNVDDTVFIAEKWGPESKVWSLMASMHQPRVYHSSVYSWQMLEFWVVVDGQVQTETPYMQALNRKNGKSLNRHICTRVLDR